ncbi:hypothetical protein BDQ12DRAFT_683189 [Crucibulum laeve]|uniref:Uncharacterized protein n=1 Tax=Crucibulum laeve TaxID=68775 RepID=A0A5C3M2V9_9AGAR|nr:hypothetical protein BDQ12DRAFT_683189 [Crucibulum laeve]
MTMGFSAYGQLTRLLRALGMFGRRLRCRVRMLSTAGGPLKTGRHVEDGQGALRVGEGVEGESEC